MKCYICGEEAKVKKHNIELCHLCAKVDETANRMILKSANIELLNKIEGAKI